MNYLRKRLSLENINKKIKEQNVISFFFFYLEQDIKKIHFFYWLSNVLFHGIDTVLPIKQVKFLGFRCLFVKEFFFFNTGIYNKLWGFFFAGFLFFQGFATGLRIVRGINYTIKTEKIFYFGTTTLNKNIFFKRHTLNILFNSLSRFGFLYQKNQQKKKTEISFSIKINKNVFFVHLMLQKKCKKTQFFCLAWLRFFFARHSQKKPKPRKKVSLIGTWEKNPVFFNEGGSKKPPIFFCFAKKPLRHLTNYGGAPPHLGSKGTPSSMYTNFLYFYFFIVKKKNANIKRRDGVWKNLVEVVWALDLMVKKGNLGSSSPLFLRWKNNIIARCDFFSVTKKLIKKTFFFFVLGIKKKKERNLSPRVFQTPWQTSASQRFLGHCSDVSYLFFPDFDIGWKITSFKKKKKTFITVCFFLHRVLFIFQFFDISNLIIREIIQKKRHQLLNNFKKDEQVK